MKSYTKPHPSRINAVAVNFIPFSNFSENREAAAEVPRDDFFTSFPGLPPSEWVEKGRRRSESADKGSFPLAVIGPGVFQIVFRQASRAVCRHGGKTRVRNGRRNPVQSGNDAPAGSPTSVSLDLATCA